MNQDVIVLGMKDTHFSNTAGISMDDHYSTAHDLALLGQALSVETDYLYYSKQQSFTYNLHFHRATNILLKQDATVDGLKTGFTKAAGYNLALTANRLTTNFDSPNRRLIVVVLGAQNAFKRAEIAHKLMNLAYTYSRNEVIIKDKQLIAELPVVQSTLKMFKVESKQPKLATTALYNPEAVIDLNQFDNVNYRIMQPDQFGVFTTVEPLSQTKTHLNVELVTSSLTAPLAKMVQLAQVNVYQDNKLIQSIMIEDEVKIEEASWFEKFINWFKALFSFGSEGQAKIHLLN